MRADHASSRHIRADHASSRHMRAVQSVAVAPSMLIPDSVHVVVGHVLAP
jgi:hypothetical protein